MLSLIGISMILIIVILLVWGKASPIVAMIAVPLIGAFIAGFGLDEIALFFEAGIDKVLNVAIMFIFAILFFGVLQDTGFFEPIIKAMVRLTKGNVVTVAVGTAAIGMVAHLDGAGATTFLLTIPALLPLYKRLHMSPYLLVLIVGLSASIMNMVPWAGPTGRVAGVLDMSLLNYGIRFPYNLGLCSFHLHLALGFVKRNVLRNWGYAEAAASSMSEADLQEALRSISSHGDKALKRYHLIWANALIFVGVLIILVAELLPAGYSFMVGLVLALVVNYPNVQTQMDRVKAHSPSALLMAAVILAAGTFLGIIDESGMLESIAVDSISILPAAILPVLHLIVGLFGVPFDMVTSTDAYYYALFPIVESITAQVGVASTSTAYAMIIGNVVGTFVSPLAPAVWLAVGLAGIDMGKYIRYAFFWVWGFSIVLVLLAVLIGVIQF
ncbi:LOW QUALITY PROTEIN: magnesium citrate secondary transporter [Bacillus sp. JCM 19046]|nr:LOW QUALITY PROTEIN: magnesium citrate secondary transporter [Bacillus sp. JCM 19045]GAF16979.1 LOW QUALITY PROTEIN: magnesium citrate secondary transporter [Bacillus sp. JCM 19046]